MRKMKLIVVFAGLAFLLMSCGKNYPTGVRCALAKAGINREELKKVIDHYSKSDADSLKRKAACFLIENMIPYYSVDSMEEIRFRPYYRIFDSISRVYNSEPYSPWRSYLDKTWNEYKEHTQPLTVFRKEDVHYDLEEIDPDWLIEQIDLAFQAWQENVYTRNDSFDDFCEYILPYRRLNGTLLENSRKQFYMRHRKDSLFKDPSRDFQKEFSRLIFQYQDVGYTWGCCADMPVLSIRTMSYIQKGSCSQRAWFNTVLGSSLGLGVAIDFLPRWGNKSPNHSWNVVICNGKSIAFDPYGLGGMWQNSKIYDNKTIDPVYGKWRLPKVFRYTFSNRMKGPGWDKRLKREDVPPVFQNIRIKDVSEEYFETKDIVLEIPENPENNYYAYLCVLGDNKDWIPVYWGEIKEGKATFEKMGKDIVYMPAFYKGGVVLPIPQKNPFWLKSDGSIEELYDKGTTQTICIRNVKGDFTFDKSRIYRTYLKRAFFLGKNEKGEFCDTLGAIPDSMNIYRLKIKIDKAPKYRFVRMKLPTDTLAVNDIAFYETKNGLQKRIEGVTIKEGYDKFADSESENLDWVVDQIAASGYKGVSRHKGKSYLDFDLGAYYELSSIGYVSYTDSDLEKELFFELYYWDKGSWKYVAGKNGNNNYLQFENVPSGALYTTRSNKLAHLQRIFSYEDNEALWH